MHEIAFVAVIRIGVVVDVSVPLVVLDAHFPDAVFADSFGVPWVFSELICALGNRLSFHARITLAVTTEILLEEECSVGTRLGLLIAAIRHDNFVEL